MVEESEKFAALDKKVKEQAESKLELEKLAYSLKTGIIIKVIIYHYFWLYYCIMESIKHCIAA